MAQQTSNQSNKILYGDDDPDMQVLIKIILQRAGMQVVLAGNGQDVLDLWRRDHFDGVVLDVMMPVIDGLEICRRIRRLSQVPILLLTARGQEDEVVQGLEAGADDYIVKPIRQKEFLARLNVALKRAEKDARARSRSDSVSKPGDPAAAADRYRWRSSDSLNSLRIPDSSLFSE
jgi:two-component system response regulator MtrA